MTGKSRDEGGDGLVGHGAYQPGRPVAFTYRALSSSAQRSSSVDFWAAVGFVSVLAFVIVCSVVMGSSMFTGREVRQPENSRGVKFSFILPVGHNKKAARRRL